MITGSEGKSSDNPEKWGRINCVLMEERIMKPPHSTDVLGCFYDSTGEGVTSGARIPTFDQQHGYAMGSQRLAFGAVWVVVIDVHAYEDSLSSR